CFFRHHDSSPCSHWYEGENVYENNTKIKEFSWNHVIDLFIDIYISYAEEVDDEINERRRIFFRFLSAK
ncbi:MAG: hypothetical protein OXG62_09820, partial [Nitrospinae bacterium]|nr:hypothetical protein [Nitrospinota bacterium]